jgi:hypothetical protein
MFWAYFWLVLGAGLFINSIVSRAKWEDPLAAIFSLLASAIFIAIGLSIWGVI